MNSNNKYVMGLDVGTTGVKAYVIDKTTKVIGQHYMKVTVHYGMHGEVEIDPENVVRVAIEVTKKAMESANTKAADIVALGISTQRNTFTCWDKTTGEACHPLITWSDLRAARDTVEANKTLRVKAVRALTRLLYWITWDSHYQAASNYKFTTQQMILKLSWVWRHIPKVKELYRQGRLMIGTLDTWLMWKLSDGTIYATDDSNASATGVYDPYVKNFSSLLWFLADLPPQRIFPTLCPTSGNFGFTAPHIFGAPILIGAAVGDQSASLFGHCAFNSGDIKCSLGTGGFIDLNTGTKCLYSPQGLYPLVAWRLNNVVTFMQEGTFGCAGTIMEWMIRVGLVTEIAESEAIAKSVNDTNDVFFVPAFDGLFVPHFDRRARGAIVGLSLSTTKAHIVRAILESMGHSIAQIIDVIRKDLNMKITRLQVDGGVARNNFVLQHTADMTNCEIVRLQQVDMSVLGAAFLAGLSCGFWKDQSELLSFRQEDKSFFPNISEKERHIQKTQFADAVSRSREWHQDYREKTQVTLNNSVHKSSSWNPFIFLLAVFIFLHTKLILIFNKNRDM
jgi:putative glycerol kinase 5